MMMIVPYLLVMIATATSASADAPWSYCQYPKRGGVANTAAYDQSTAAPLCPSEWATKYPQCGVGVQAPLALTAVPTDMTLRPLDLNWFAIDAYRILQSPEPQLRVIPVDVNPALLDPNDGVTYALREYRFLSPSEHSFGGSRADIEIQFIHSNRATDTLAEGVQELVVSLLVDAAATAPVNMPARQMLFPIFGLSQMVVDPNQLNRQVAELSQMAPPSRNYVRYVAAGSRPPCSRTTYYVLEFVSTFSAAGLDRMRGALNLTLAATPYVVDASGAPPRARDGNARPYYTGAMTFADARDAPRRFSDMVGDDWYDASPSSAALNTNVDAISIAALCVSCVAAFVAMAAARIASA